MAVLSKNTIIEELYRSRDFNDCINKMHPEDLQDDLRSEVIIILLETNEDKIQGMHQKGQLRFYAVRIIRNLIQSNTSPFYKMFRQSNTVDTELPEIGYSDEQYADEHKQREEKEALEDEAVQRKDSLYWYDKQMIDLYIQFGSYRNVQKEIARRTDSKGIPHQSCHQTITNALKRLRNEIKPV